MELEIERYQILKKLFNNAQPIPNNVLEISNLNHFYILQTRFLYIKTFNSMPSEQIWNFKYLLEYNDIKNNNFNSSIKIIISYNLKNILELNLNINSYNTFEYIKIKLIDMKHIKNSDKLIFISPNNVIDLKDNINDTNEICIIVI
jgi:hypothetical protein